MKRIIALILVLAATAAGQSYPDTITITSADLPYTVAQNNVCIRIAPSIGQSFRINSNTNGIIVTNRINVLIVGVYTGAVTYDQRATLNFAAAGGDAQYGISINSSNGVVIKDLNIYAGMGALDDDNDSGNTCVRITGSARNVEWRNCGIYPDGLDGKGISQTVDASYNSYNLRTTGCDFYQYSNKFTRRDYYMASLIKGELSKIVEYPDYHWQIDSCNFTRSIHVAVAITGSQVPTDSGALVYVFDNEFHQDGTNLRYTTFTDNATQSLGDNFAMSFIGLRRRSEIHNNRIYGDVTASGYGGMGILIQGAHGWPDRPVQFYDNTMVLRSGRHIALSALKQSTQGFYIRALDGINGNQNLWVFRNNIKIYVDTAQATTSTGRIAEGIRVLVSTPDHDIIISDNHVSVNRSDSAAGLGNGTGESEVIANGITIAQATDLGDRVRVMNNYFGAPIPIRYGSNRESSLGANNTFLFADTFAAYRDCDTTIWFETNGSYVGHSINNVHQDCVWLGYANPYDIVFAGGSSVDSLGKSVEHWQTVNIYCKGSNGQPMPQAAVHYANAFREGILGYSDLTGWLQVAVKVRYDHHDYVTGDGYNPGDSVFNPFVIHGISGATYSDTTTLSITPTVYTDTLTFAVAGTATPTGDYVMRRKKLNPATDAILIGPPAE